MHTIGLAFSLVNEDRDSLFARFGGWPAVFEVLLRARLAKMWLKTATGFQIKLQWTSIGKRLCKSEIWPAAHNVVDLCCKLAAEGVENPMLSIVICCFLMFKSWLKDFRNIIRYFQSLRPNCSIGHFVNSCNEVWSESSYQSFLGTFLTLVPCVYFFVWAECQFFLHQLASVDRQLTWAGKVGLCVALMQLALEKMMFSFLTNPKFLMHCKIFSVLACYMPF